MVVRIIVALIVILAIIQGLAAGAIPENIVSIALVILGLVYGGMALDAEDATSFLVVALAVGAAAGADVLSNIQVIGEKLDAIVDPITIALYAGVITVFAKRVWNRVSASGDGGGESAGGGEE
ncbi:MAG: hypothetical protein F4W91_15065 [Gemmatimonadetes bacterium]|nr:hypothetical protein [Gemmatimonadota bacterium]